MQSALCDIAGSCWCDHNKCHHVTSRQEQSTIHPVSHNVGVLWGTARSFAFNRFDLEDKKPICYFVGHDGMLRIAMKETQPCCCLVADCCVRYG